MNRIEKVLNEIDGKLEELYGKLPDASKVIDGTATTEEIAVTGQYTAYESIEKTIKKYFPKYIDERIQYASVDDGIYAHAETYSFNIPSELFDQLTPEQQKLWRKDIEDAVISGGYCGVELARDERYEENQEKFEDSLKDELSKYIEKNFTIEKDVFDRFGLDPKNYMYSMDKSDMLKLVKFFAARERKITILAVKKWLEENAYMYNGECSGDRKDLINDIDKQFNK